jgi:hypothetical protein
LINDYKELITKYPEAAPILHQLYKVLCDIKEVIKYTPPSVGESEEWAAIVSSSEANRESFSKTLRGKLPFTALRGTFTVMPKELKYIVKVCGQRGQTSETDGFKEISSRKRHCTEEAALTLKEATLPETSAEVATNNFFAPLRTANMERHGGLSGRQVALPDPTTFSSTSPSRSRKTNEASDVPAAYQHSR